MSDEDRAAEAADEKRVAHFRGHDFTLPEYGEWSLDLHEAIEDGKNLAVLRAALGPEQWAIVRGMDLQTPGIDELAGAVSKALGFASLDPSGASSD